MSDEKVSPEDISKINQMWAKLEKLHSQYMYFVFALVLLSIFLAALSHRLLESWFLFGFHTFLAGFYICDLKETHFHHKRRRQEHEDLLKQIEEHNS